MKVLIVDDEPLAQSWLKRLVAGIDGAQVCGVADNGQQAIDQARLLRPDVVLLDIQIPGVDGLTVARELTWLPIVFTTAHSRYALEAFEIDACDYVMKPVTHELLDRALKRARRRLELQENARIDALPSSASPRPTAIAVHQSGRRRYIDARRVARFRALDKYTSFLLNGEEHLVRDSLDSLASRLQNFGFLRVHRSDLVRGDAISEVVTDGTGMRIILVDGQHVPVSRRYAPAVKRFFTSR